MINNIKKTNYRNVYILWALVFVVALLIVGIKSNAEGATLAPPEQKALVCGGWRDDTSTTGQVSGAGTTWKFDSDVRYKRCHNGGVQSATAAYVRLDLNAIVKHCDPNYHLYVISSPFAGRSQGNATVYPCDDSQSSYSQRWSAAGEGYTIFKSNPTSYRCMDFDIQLQSQFGTLKTWHVPAVCVTFD